jgi:hypothetical protein
MDCSIKAPSPPQKKMRRLKSIFINPIHANDIFLTPFLDIV